MFNFVILGLGTSTRKRKRRNPTETDDYDGKLDIVFNIYVQLFKTTF